VLGHPGEIASGEIEIERDQRVAVRKVKVNKDDATRLQGLDLREDVDVATQLRDALTKNSMRVIDLFREWDDDNSGTVSKKEFIRAMRQMGYEASKEEIGKLFASWDPDGSGMIEIKELNKQLRAGSAVKLDAKLQPGAAGEIELWVDQKSEVRTAKDAQDDANPLQGPDLDESKVVAEQVTRGEPSARDESPSAGPPPHLGPRVCS